MGRIKNTGVQRIRSAVTFLFLCGSVLSHASDDLKETYARALLFKNRGLVSEALNQVHRIPPSKRTFPVWKLLVQLQHMHPDPDALSSAARSARDSFSHHTSEARFFKAFEDIAEKRKIALARFQKWNSTPFIYLYKNEYDKKLVKKIDELAQQALLQLKPLMPKHDFPQFWIHLESSEEGPHSTSHLLHTMSLVIPSNLEDSIFFERIQMGIKRKIAHHITHSLLQGTVSVKIPFWFEEGLSHWVGGSSADTSFVYQAFKKGTLPDFEHFAHWSPTHHGTHCTQENLNLLPSIGSMLAKKVIEHIGRDRLLEWLREQSPTMNEKEFTEKIASSFNFEWSQFYWDALKSPT